MKGFAFLGTIILVAQLAEAGNAVEWTTERVVVFKDGFVLFIKRGIGTTNEDGALVTEAVPAAAVLGTVWAVPEEGRLLGMTVGTTTATKVETETAACSGLSDVLARNVGKTIVADLQDGQSVRGKVSAVLKPQPRDSHELAPFSSTAASTAFFVVETAAGDVLLSTADVRRFTILEMETSCERKTVIERKTKQLTFRFERKGAPRVFRLMYFAPNFRWIPSYRMELPLQDGAPAELRLQAELLNEAEDLIDADVDLVVGAPHFRFKEVSSPLTLETTLRKTLAEVAPMLASQQLAFSNATIAESAETLDLEGAASLRELSLPPELSAQAHEDFFVYSLGNQRIRKGERAAVPIFSTHVPSRDLYTWSLHVRRNSLVAPEKLHGDAPPLALSQNRVWHQVVLTNETTMPWTTGPVLLFHGNQPLAQEILTYTSPGGEVRVPVAVAVNTRAAYRERETARLVQALRWNGWDFARLDLEGTVTVASAERVPVDLEIELSLGGEAGAISDDGISVVPPFDRDDWVAGDGRTTLNPHSNVRWSLRLEPGGTASRSLAYHYFARP